MPLVTTDLPSVAPREAGRAIDFARACKAAARAVALYPDGHPAIASTLSRLVTLTSPEQRPDPLRLGVLADHLLLEGRTLPRTDAAITVDRGVTDDELATFVAGVTADEPTSPQRPNGAGISKGGEPIMPPMPHIRVGRVSVDEATERCSTDMSGCRRL